MQAARTDALAERSGVRTYVDVFVRVSADGREEPQLIILPDTGRTFVVTRTTSHHRVVGGEVFSVQIGTHMTTLWKDARGMQGSRWYVKMRAGRG